MLELHQMAPHEWEFAYPPEYDDLLGEFHSGCELYEEGNLGEAERVFQAVLARMPDHLDAIHHLAIVLSQRGLPDRACDLWEQAVRIGRKALPKDFQIGKDRLEWGWLDNRPFLRCVHGLALARYGMGETEDGLKLFLDLLSLNPGDNQGVRAMAQEALFKLCRVEEALKIAEKYPDDSMPETVYGRALALFKLGRQREATRALQEAIEYLPLVATELLKSRHHMPRGARRDVITSGGADQAYYYWERSGQFWKEDPAALEWLKQTMRSPARTR